MLQKGEFVGYQAPDGAFGFNFMQSKLQKSEILGFEAPGGARGCFDTKVGNIPVP